MKIKMMRTTLTLEEASSPLNKLRQFYLLFNDDVFEALFTLDKAINKKKTDFFWTITLLLHCVYNCILLCCIYIFRFVGRIKMYIVDVYFRYNRTYDIPDNILVKCPPTALVQYQIFGCFSNYNFAIVDTLFKRVSRVKYLSIILIKYFKNRLFFQNLISKIRHKYKIGDNFIGHIFEQSITILRSKSLTCKPYRALALSLIWCEKSSNWTSFITRNVLLPHDQIKLDDADQAIAIRSYTV